MSRPILVTPPAVPPVSLDEAKAQLRVDFADDDALITAYLDAAIGRFDGWSGILGRCLVDQEWRFYRREFPASGVLALPFPDVSAVAVTYFDETNASQTLSSGLYSLAERASGSALVLGYGSSWPSLYSRHDAVTITFTAGFGASAADVPAMIRQAILIEVSDLYQRREDPGKGSFADRVVATYGRTGIGAAFSKT